METSGMRSWRIHLRLLLEGLSFVAFVRFVVSYPGICDRAKPRSWAST
jgi:hypothetical protein